MESCVYLLNSTPKYYWILPLHCLLIKRYARKIEWPIVLATEVPDHPICKRLVREYDVKLLLLDPKKEGFLDSRAEALRILKDTTGYKYVFPVQDDFLLDREPDYEVLQEAFDMMELDVSLASVRLMPCPGPHGPSLPARKRWAALSYDLDEYGFSYQATLWRIDPCAEWYKRICRKLDKEWPPSSTTPEQRRRLEIVGNFAENSEGQRFFWKFSMETNIWHAAWVRQGKWSNAVYLSGWPYRPTAIVSGVTAPWAKELAQREGEPFS
jgi:hypothetical protein